MLTGSLARANGDDFNNISLFVSTTRRHRMANRNNIDKKNSGVLHGCLKFVFDCLLGR
jgi:hypothetical protein